MNTHDTSNVQSILLTGDSGNAAGTTHNKTLSFDGTTPLPAISPEMLFLGDYSRNGPDLLIEHAGENLLIVDYFSNSTPPDLLSPNGAMLSGALVSTLAGNAADAQYAQVGGNFAPNSIGKVVKLEGEASSTSTSGTRTQLTLGDAVYQGDVVETGSGAKLGISFIDETVFSMSGDARMVLDEVIFDPGNSGDSSMVLNLVQGAFVFATGQIAPNGNMQIETPLATMGIRGTTPQVLIDAALGVVEYSILPDPDTGNVGEYVLINRAGEVIGTVRSTGDKWVLSSLSSEPVLIQKSGLDLLQDRIALDEIRDVFARAAGDRASLDGANSFQRVAFNLSDTGGIDINDDGNGDGGNGGDIVFIDQNPEFDDPPIAADDIFFTDDRTTIETGPNVIDDNGTGIDIDPEGFDLIVTQINGTNIPFPPGTPVDQQVPVDLPSGAQLQVSRNGDITYSPNGAYNFLGLGDQDTDQFDYTLQDAGGQTDIGTIQVQLTGRNDQPELTDIASTVLSDAFTEITDTGNTALIRTGSGLVTFEDTDASDTHTPSAATPTVVWTQDSGTTVNLAEIGSIQLTLTETPPNPAPVIEFTDDTFLTVASRPTDVVGEVEWVYSVAEADVDFLAVGETLVLTYPITVTDDSGVGAGGNGDSPAFVTRDVTITITGTNDTPTIEAALPAEVTKTIAETEGALSTGGSFDIGDVDTTDVVTVDDITLVVSGQTDTTLPDNAALLAMFSTQDAIEIAGDATTGTVNWDFNAGTDAFDYLAVGETLTLTYTITVTDDNG
ncbi:MAG: VCBS domain-containing protein, partial [Pseudomonadota bacterium]